MIEAGFYNGGKLVASRFFASEAGIPAGWRKVTSRGVYIPAPSPTNPRDALLAVINAKAAALLGAGYPVSHEGQTYHVALDDGARADLTAMATTAIAAVAGSVPWPSSYQTGWITFENVRIPLAAPETGLALAAGAGDYYARIIQHRRDLKDAALAAADEAALAAIDPESGWPQ